MSNIISWEEIFSKQKEKKVIKFEKRLNVDEGTSTGAICNSNDYKKVIILQEYHGFSYYLALDIDGNWAIYRNKIKGVEK